jgi:hypothetical protein
MNKNFWDFIKDSNFIKSACQVDIAYYNLLKNGYKHIDILKFKNEYKEKFQLLKGNLVDKKGYIISKGEEKFLEFISQNKSVDDLQIELPFDFELSNFYLIFTDIPSGECYPEINDSQNLFMSLSTTNVDVLLKMLFIYDTKSFIIDQISGRSSCSKESLIKIIKQQKIEHF